MRKVISWDEYFMGLALMVSKRSKDDRTQVGSVIVDGNKRIVSTGYNGMPNNCDDKTMPWGLDPGNYLNHKHYYVCHAELNAIIGAKRDLSGATVYTTLYPCNECAKLIVQSGIKEVVYLSEKFNKDFDMFKASIFLLKKAGIKVRKFKTNLDKITISFDEKEV